MGFINFLVFSACLFFIGLVGIFFNRKNVLITLMSIELMLLSVNLIFLITSSFIDDIVGQIYAVFVLTIAAAESSIGLAILVVYYRLRGTISLDLINSLKG